MKTYRKYGIYVMRKNSNDNFVKSAMGWYRNAFYPSMQAAKKALDRIVEDLEDDGWDCDRTNTVTVKGVRTDTTPYPTTEKITYHIEYR